MKALIKNELRRSRKNLLIWLGIMLLLVGFCYYEYLSLKDSLDDSEYVLDEGMDMLHSLAFKNKILSYPLKSNSIKEGQEEWGDEIYIQVDTELFLENEHFDTARIFINKKMRLICLKD